MKKRYSVLLLLIFSYSLLFSQITLNSGNFPFPGMHYVRYYYVGDTIGPAGAGVHYNFSPMFMAFSDTLEYLDATATPFYSQHPGTGSATYFDDGNGSGRYYYYNSDASAFWEAGATLIADFGTGTLDTVHSVYQPQYVDTLVSNQYTYGHAETEHTITTFIIFVVVQADLHKVKNISVDGWGSLDTPFNHFDKVLRVKYTEYTFDSVFIAGNFDSAKLDTLYYYKYFAQDIPCPVVIAHTDSVDKIEYMEIIKVEPTVFGCTDSLAINFNPAANTDDGSCIYCTPFSFILTPDTFICAGDTISLSVTGGTAWNWSTGDTTSMISIAPLQTTGVSVYVSEQPLCWETGNVTVEVNDTVTAGFWINAGSFTNNDTIQFINTSANADSWYWEFDDPVDGTSLLENPHHIYSSIGDKNIMLISSNACFSDTAYQMITITEIEELAQIIEKLKIYPNPGNSSSTLEYNLSEQSEVIIRFSDIYGKQYACLKLPPGEASGRLQIGEIAENLSAGIYIISLQAEKSMLSVKWIKL
ncbi:MAG: T9SS type A sorting domain-containing protein [Bacteroidota bacterium]